MNSHKHKCWNVDFVSQHWWVEGILTNTSLTNHLTSDSCFHYLHVWSPSNESLSVLAKLTVEVGQDLLCLHQRDMDLTLLFWEQTSNVLGLRA